MKTLFYIVGLVLVLVTCTRCASTPRNKLTDPTHRVAVDNAGIEAKHFVQIVNALKENGRFIIVDRSRGFEAILKEQEREHKDMPDRFADREKYALWARVFGLGAIIIAHADCTVKSGFFKKNYPHCREYLSMIDARSGEVISSASAEENGDSDDYMDLAPSWDSVVSDLVDNVPDSYEANKDHKRLLDYKELAAEEAQRMREKNAREPASKE